MTASEKLRALGPPFDLTQTHSWIEYDDGVTREIGSMVTLYDALPLIADVVEAAERAVWCAENESQADRHAPILRREVAPALTALRDALEER